MRLFKGESTDSLGCEIFHASFCDRETSISYDALSYTWGNDEDRRILYVRGGQLEVTPNLYVALEALRSSTQDRILWIDALCINQSSPGERQHQVGQMGRIYGNADTVLFWLGPSTSATNIALESLRRLQEKSVMYNCRAWDRKDQRWDKLWSDLLPGLEDTYPDLLSRQRKGLEDLLSRSWFERVWILQEAAKSKKALVCCGDMFVSARIFTIAPRLFGVEPSPHCQAVLDIMPGPSRQDSWWSQEPNLYTLLKKFCRSKASDPRDMIFALLGLASDAQADGFPSANYNQDEVDVVREVLVFICSIDPGYVPVSADKDIWFYTGLAGNTISMSQFLSSLDLLSDSDLGANSRLSQDPENLPNLLGKTTIPSRKAPIIPAQYLRGREIWDVLLQQWSSIEVPKTVVKEAARNGGKEDMELLLQRRPEQISITRDVIEAAVENNAGGNEIVAFLLHQRGYETTIAAARTSQGEDMVIRLLSDEMACSTENIIKAAVMTWSRAGLRQLFKKMPPRATMTPQDIMKAVVGYSEPLRSGFHEKKWHKWHETMVAHEGVQDSKEWALDLLLQERGNEITITEEIMKVALRNPKERLLEFLLRERGHEIAITEEIMKVAAQNAKLWVLDLLRRRRTGTAEA